MLINLPIIQLHNMKSSQKVLVEERNDINKWFGIFCREDTNGSGHFVAIVVFKDNGIIPNPKLSQRQRKVESILSLYMSNLLRFFIQYFDGIDIVWVERVSLERHFVIFAGII